MKACGWRPLHTADPVKGPGQAPKQRGFLRAAWTIVVVLLLLNGVGGFIAKIYTEHLWFQEVGYVRVFWTRNLAAIGVRAIAALVAAGIIFLNLTLVVRRLGPVRLRHRYGNLEIAEQVPRHQVMTVSALIALLGGLWLAGVQFGAGVPLQVWAWFNHVAWGSVDPLFNKDLSFYVFTLPVILHVIDHLLLTVFWTLVLVIIGYSLVGGIRMTQTRAEMDPNARTHFAALAAIFLCVLALRFVAGRYSIVLNGTGVHGGVGYTDVHARIMGQWAMAWLALLAAVSIVYGMRKSLIAPPIAGITAFIIGGIVFGAVIPAVVQKFRVQPDQLAREAPYLQWNLDFTRQGFGVADVARKHVAYTVATPASWDAAAPTLTHLALWDVDQLKDTFDQVQSFQGYYTFSEIDFDRYPVNGEVQQVGIGVREFKSEGLPAGSRNWFNLHRRPEFTRGVGVASAQARAAVSNAPDYLVGEIAPIRIAPSVAGSMSFTDPSIYFGEVSNEYIVLGADSTGQPPRGGVGINSILRVAAFAWRFADHNLLFTGNLDDKSRVLFHRLVHERVEEVAPFLTWDRDALPVLADGHVQWVLDGYTTSSSFPMAEHRTVGRANVNYIRGSVKATVDAVTGAVRLYAIDAGDPILRSYSAMFPGLVRKTSEMPAWLRSHLRYPASLLAVQAAVLEQYHVDKTNAFFAGQDAWTVPPQGAARGTPRPDEPVNMMLQIEGTPRPQFVSVLPFTARERQNLTAILIAQHDSTAYGKLTLIDLSGEEQIKGPGQIQSLIEQDPEISQQLALWRQRGTNVELGQLRIIPAGNSILYVEPLFIAAEDKAIPQLHRVLVSDGTNAVMAETLPEAVQKLAMRNGGTSSFTGADADAFPPAGTGARGAEGAGIGASGTGVAPGRAGAPGSAANTLRPPGSATWPAEALRLYDQAEAQLKRGDFAGFGASWQKLRAVLQKANAEQGR